MPVNEPTRRKFIQAIGGAIIAGFTPGFVPGLFPPNENGGFFYNPFLNDWIKMHTKGNIIMVSTPYAPNKLFYKMVNA